MKKTVVIFDLDGTLLNTLDDLADSTNAALAAHGFPCRTVEEVRGFVGNGIRRLIERALPETADAETAEQVLQTFRAHYAAHCTDKTRPYDGVMELMAALRETGCRTAVVSNKADFAVQKLCAQYFPGLIDLAVGEREGVQKKPAPDSVLEVLSHLKEEKAHAVYVGDSEVDILTAKNAGVDLVCVEWGFRSRAFLRAQGAIHLIETPEALWRYL